ncbi:MAG: hypothetical protein D6701_15625 [Gemmatimonadetes bacterium]|nr:MAG: hypothetical protein D6701_15625 [Gemmatimonadota bacterium]
MLRTHLRLPLPMVIGALLGLSGLPAPVHAQTDGLRVAAEVSLRVGATRVAGASRTVVGGGASLLLGDRFSLGGAGFGLTRTVGLGADADALDLRVGYGGVDMAWILASSRRLSVSGALLVGAGNGEVRSAATGAELGFDNFLVFEPGLRLGLVVAGPVRLDLRAGYRWTTGVGDLPSVDGDDLEGYMADVGLTVGHRR